jgi:phage shock protein C
MIPRLFRPTTDRVGGGVCSGLGLYFGLDPVLIRLLFVVLAITTGITIVLYPILWAIMPSGTPSQPLPPGARFDPQTGQPLPTDVSTTGQTVPFMAEPGAPPPRVEGRNRILALVLVGVGSLILISKLGDLVGIHVGSFAIPVLLVGLGAYLLLSTRRTRM